MIRTATEEATLEAATAVEAADPTGGWVDALSLDAAPEALEQAVRDGLLEWSHAGGSGTYFRVAR